MAYVILFFRGQIIPSGPTVISWKGLIMSLLATAPDFLLAAPLYSNYGLIGTIILILDIVAIVSVLTGNGSPGHKLLWTLLILVLPLVGLVLYFLIGRSAADRPVGI